jgi:hypothetical protein
MTVRYYIFVIDGEVAGRIPLFAHPNGGPLEEKYRAMLESDPKIIPSDEDVPEGYLWDGKNFNPPVE